jgi:hypothetical protein
MVPVEGIQYRYQTKKLEQNNNLQKVAFIIISLSFIFIICFYGVDEGVQYRPQTNNQE